MLNIIRSIKRAVAEQRHSILLQLDSLYIFVMTEKNKGCIVWAFIKDYNCVTLTFPHK
jgi:hypothetical protein